MWKKLICSTFISLTVSIISCYLYYYVTNNYLVIPKLLLKGSKTETISLGTTFNDPGFEAKIGNDNASDKVIISNNINLSKPGTYEIEYSISNKKGKNKVIQTRKVMVVDKEAPIITLANNNLTIYKGTKYDIPGYTAIDNYDGDITNQVVISNNVDINKIGTYNINYKVQDSNENETSADCKVDVIDYPKPVYSGVGIPVLMYHFFYDSSKGEKALDSNYMEISRFEEEMKYLSDNNYYFPTWKELEQYIDGIITLPRKSIFVTIDDGNESFFRLAYPLLKKYGIKATSFLVTSWSNPNNYDIDRNIIDFESHSNNMHRGLCSTGHGGIFQCISYDEGYNDLMVSINILGSNEVFCYPFGDYSNSAIQLLKDVGFKLAFTTQYGKVKPGMNKLLLPRIRISSNLSMTNFIKSI
jgi:peptidoglycan/xylan/chitin deacetylase (PgdA/CDA1 family)